MLDKIRLSTFHVVSVRRADRRITSDSLDQGEVLARNLPQVLDGAGQGASELVVGVVLGENIAGGASQPVELQTPAGQLPPAAQHLLTLVHVVCTGARRVSLVTFLNLVHFACRGARRGESDHSEGDDDTC